MVTRREDGHEEAQKAQKNSEESFYCHTDTESSEQQKIEFAAAVRLCGYSSFSAYAWDSFLRFLWPFRFKTKTGSAGNSPADPVLNRWRLTSYDNGSVP
jgi:hypothetical protein